MTGDEESGIYSIIRALIDAHYDGVSKYCADDDDDCFSFSKYCMIFFLFY